MQYEKLFNTNYLQHLAQQSDLSPHKRYGQNYLIDSEVINKILDAAQITKADEVVEVGPGFGVLTIPLSHHAKKVLAFEIEKKIEPYWNKLIVDERLNNLEIIWGNVLKQEAALNEKILGEYKVVANLPYQITSPLIRFFLEGLKRPREMILMVQKEVGERLTAKPGEMSLLAVSAQYYADAEYLFTVPKTSFWPSPQVDSAVIKLKLKNLSAGERELANQVFALARAGFSSKRKLLSKNLEGSIGKKRKIELAASFAELGLLPTVRAQELSIAEWVELAKIFGSEF